MPTKKVKNAIDTSIILPESLTTQNLYNLSRCAAFLNHILLHSNAVDLLSADERKYCHKINTYLHKALDEELFKYSGFEQQLKIIDGNITKIAIRQQLNLAEKSELAARAAFDEVTKRLESLLALQRKVLIADSQDKIAKTRTIRLMRWINSTLTNGEFNFRKFDEVISEMQAHFKSRKRANSLIQLSNEQLIEMCMELLQQIAINPDYLKLLTNDEKNYCAEVNDFMIKSKTDFSYKYTDFTVTAHKMVTKLMLLAVAQQKRLAKVTRQEVKSANTEIKFSLDALLRFKNKVVMAIPTMDTIRSVLILQQISDTLINAEYTAPNFRARLSKLQAFFRKGKNMAKFATPELESSVEIPTRSGLKRGYFKNLDAKNKKTKTETTKKSKPKKSL